jgi:hypothetical protein
MADLDTQTITNGISAATLLGVVIACIRLAIGQADKRAVVAEQRETVCMTTLTAMTTTVQALTTEVHKGGEEEVRILKDNNALGRENTRRLDAGLRQLHAIQRDLESCVGELRSGR